MKANSLLAGIGVVLMVLGFVKQAVAQAPPGTYADANHPAGPPDPEKLDQIWQVDPITGSVSITIPFTTTPAGGRGPKIPFSLHYNSSSTVTLQSDFDSVVSYGDAGELGGIPATGTVQFFGWSTGDLTGKNQSPLGPWATSGPFFYNHGSYMPGQPAIDYQINGIDNWIPAESGCTIIGPYIYTDASGASHDMNLETTTATNSSGQLSACTDAYDASKTYGKLYFTTDGSALETSSYPESVVQPDGTSVSDPTGVGATLEDSNGNTATFGHNASGVMAAIDSLGRTAFSTTIPIGYTGQIPVGTYNVTTTGASGNIESYSVVFSQISIGSFKMPHPASGSSGSPSLEMTGNNASLAVEQPTTGDLHTTLPVISSITMPDSTGYTFTYDLTYGTISKITFPTGGYVRFVWGIRGNGGANTTFSALSTLVATEACTSIGSSGTESCWQYSYQDYSSTTGLTSTVTAPAPDGSYTVYNSDAGFIYSVVPDFKNGAPSWKETSRLEYNSSGTLMKSVATMYGNGDSNEGLTTQVATTLYDGPTPLQQYVQYFYDGYANVVEKDESDFNPCAGIPCSMPTTTPSFLRKTFTSYAYAISNPALLTANIVDKPYQVLVTDSGGNPASLTTYTYDEPANIGVCSGTSCPTGLSNHDSAYDGNNSVARGNVTTESNCISGISASFSNGSFTASCGSAWNKHYYYDWSGQLTEKTEGVGISADNTIRYIWSGPSGTNDGYDGFMTQVQYPDGTSEQFTYWQPIGAIASHTDVNGQTTNYAYTDPSSGAPDPLNRIRTVTLPATVDGTTGISAHGATVYTYTDSAGAFSVQEQHLITGSIWTSTTKTFDGLGRVVQTATAVPTTQCSGGTLYTLTAYDEMSRVYSTSNPYCNTADPTYGLTYFAYDALGRKTQTTLPDGSVSAIAYAGNATETTDPFNGTTFVQHIQQNDGLGRLTNVCEVGLSSQTGSAATACGTYISGFGTPVSYINFPANGELTTYTYNPLGSMLSVNQHGLARSFTYDGLSRLTSALNPEVGTDSYGYSSSSAACSTSADVPCSRIDARGVQTAYAYDSMSRLTSKYYSAASGNTTGGVTDLTSCYLYGTSSASNTAGRLIAEWQQAGSCSSTPPSTAIAVRYHPSYDAMGRVLIDQQCLTGSTCSSSTGYFVYTYNLLGNPIQSNNGIFAAPVSASQTAPANPTSGNGTPITAPSITWRTTYDIADHINFSGVQDQPGSTMFSAATDSFAPTLLNPTAYDAFSHMTGAQVGIPNGSTTPAITIARQYDNRGRITSETDGGESLPFGASPATGTVTFSGAEQSTPAYSGGFFTFSGTEQTIPVSTYASATLTVTGSEQSITSGSTTTYDTGVIVAMIFDKGANSAPCEATPDYEQNSTTTSLAAALASGINSSCSGMVAATVSASTTNLIQNSSQIGGNGWVGYCGNTLNMTLDSHTISAPDGTQTATQFVLPSVLQCGSAGAYGALIQIPGGLTAGATYTVSAWLRGAVGGESVLIGLNDCASTPFTLTAQWQRYSVTYSNISTSVVNCEGGGGGTRGFQVLSNASPSVTYYVWGAQTEQASSSGPYVATSTGPAAGGGAIVTITSTTAGSAGDYAITAGDYAITVGGGHSSIFSAPSFTVTPSGPFLSNSVYDSGTFNVSIGTCSVNLPYGLQSTAGSLATALAASINSSASCSALVTATSDGGLTFFTSKSLGAAYNYSLSSTLSGFNTPAFSSPSFTLTPSAPTMEGGGESIYDSGLLIVLVNNHDFQINYGQTDTPHTLAVQLASTLGCAYDGVQAAVSGATVTLTSCADTPSDDFAIQAYADGFSPPFTKSSFNVTTSGADLTGGAVATSTPQTIYSYTVPSGGYAPNGNILNHTDSVMGTWSFNYDAVDRLTAASSGSNAPAGLQSESASWSYDSYGNRTAQSFSNGANSNWATYNSANNRIRTAKSAVAGYVYDASGNTLYDGNNEYWYDAEGQLCAAQNLGVSGTPATQYIYDAEGARIGKITLAAPPARYSVSVAIVTSPSCAPPLLAALNSPGVASGGATLTARYLVDLGGDQVTELNTTSGTMAWAHSNVFSAARLTATYDKFGLHYELADPLGTKRVQANISGQTEMSWTSLPFGDALTPIVPTNALPTADDATEHHFTGKERDSESGNDYFEARYYSSAMGRFMSPDWSVQVEPVPYATMGDPQSLNLYAYVGNNPLTRRDLDGHVIALGCAAGTSSTQCSQDKGTEESRLAANASATDKNGTKESSLFKQSTDKNGKTTMTLDKDAASKWSGDHSAGYNLLTGAISAKATISVEMTTTDDPHTGPADAHGNSTVYLPRNVSALDIVSPLKGLNGQNVPNPFQIIAGHEVLGHAYASHILGLTRGMTYNQEERWVRQNIENTLRQEQGIPLRDPNSN